MPRPHGSTAEVLGVCLYSDRRNTFWRFDLAVPFEATQVKWQYSVPGLRFPSGAVTLSTTVTGEKEGVLGLVKLDPGVTIQQAFGLVQSHHGDPNALAGYASIVASAGAPKGTSTVATVLTPGNYAAIDFAPNGKPPVATFTVTQSSNSTKLPAAAGTVKEIEFAFEGPSTWKQGSVMRFENGGYVVHMTVGAGFKDKADAVKAATLLEAGKDSSAEKLATGEDDWFDSNSPGAVQQETIAQKPGARYSHTAGGSTIPSSRASPIRTRPSSIRPFLFPPSSL